ncbi:hypothetical protein WA71_00155 [Streptococcus agalactiae]|uniref:DUF3278 domain-containing protein n=1 Tax=Streptococcus agalactiae TaxID=1311 RepID=UPI0006401CB9|nr:DUF3278 domain-containing protein [Streptococcus agalactiae]KLK43574.1 hypothetical protein WA71_00155 [Streptococcus agalactiae]
MKEKKNLGIKLIKSLYGINGPFDEYREQKINYLGNLLNDYPVAIKKNKQKFIKIGIFYTVIQWLILGLTTNNNTPLIVSLFSLKVILSSIMSGVAYNGVMYLIFKNNVDIEKDE